MRARPTASLATLVLATVALLPTAPAQAAFFTGEAIDGGAGLKSVGDVDVARDGSGAVTYVKSDGGVDHIFVARLVSGVFQAPERVDGGLVPAGSAPEVAVADGGRTAVVWVTSGQVFAAVRGAGAPGFSAPQMISAGTAPSVDMSINGVAYTSFTAPGASAADVRAARLERDGTTFTELPDTLDINAAEDAGTPGGASDVVVSADGTAVVVWGEAGHVFGRRVFENRISAAPQDLSVDTLGGHAGNVQSATDPHIDIEDDSSFAWVTFRETFDDGIPHAIARRLVGSQFEAPTQVDGVGFGGDQANTTNVAMNGRGEGLAVTGTAAQTTQVSLLHDDTFFAAQHVNEPNNVAPRPVGDFAENNDGYAAWFQGTSAQAATVQAVAYDVSLAKRTVPAPGPVTDLANPAFGPVDPAAGLDMAVDRVGDAAAVFVQGTGDGRKLVFGGYDRIPGIFTNSTTQRFRDLSRPVLAWSPSFDLWGPVTYSVELDGVVVGQTQATRLPVTTPLADGVHTMKVTATDRHGQTYVTKPTAVKVDTAAPALSFSVSGVRAKGRMQTVKVKATDPAAPAGPGSGLARVVIDFGDGARAKSRQAAHAYRQGGAHTIRVSATDNAGNVTVVKRAITLKKKSKKK